MMNLRSCLLAGAALAATAAPAFADDAAILRRLDQMQKMIQAQQKQIEAQKQEIGELRGTLHQAPGGAATAPQPASAPRDASPTPAAPAVDARLQQQDQKIDDLVARFAAAQDERRLAAQEQTQASVNNGRLSLTSADGRFSAALRLTGQYDMGYYMQSARARALSLGPNLSSGDNFRRAQIGLQGKLFGDFSYYFNMDYGSGGSTGTETPGHIQQAYIEYDGLAPFAFRIGAHPAATGLDDTYAATDQLFLERAAPADAARNMGGGDGRDAIELLYLGDRLFGSLAYTGEKVQATGAFDEQQAVVGRLATVVYSDNDWRVVTSAAATDVFRPDGTTAASNGARPFTISNPPELNVDDNSTKFVSAAGANVTDAWNWNLEGALTYDSVLAQAGYFKYGMDLRGVTSLRGQDFDGWYGEASWVLTGESRGWSPAAGAFTGPKPRVNFSLAGDGWGAFEVAARYSDLDLNDNVGLVGSAVPAGGIRGGEQRIVTLAMNWYPDPVLKFMLQVQNTQVSHISATTPFGSLNQNFDTVALRSQIGL